MKKSKRNSFKLNPIAASIVLAMASQLPVNVANAGSGWGNGTNLSNQPINVQTYYASSPSGLVPALNASGVTTPAVDPATGLATGLNVMVDSGKALRKFVDTLPTFGSATPNGLGQYIPVAVPEKWVNLNGAATTDDYYEIAAVEFSEKMHSDLPKATHLRGYVQISTAKNPGAHIALNYPNGSPILDVNGVQVYAYDNPHHLGPVISATKGTAVRVKFTNYLPTKANGGDLFLPVDTTITGAGAGPAVDALGNPINYTQNRAEINLVGGQAPWVSAGTPHQWVAPVGETQGYPKGASAQNVPDMADPGAGSATLYFPNDMSARFTFYEDRTSGITRLNTYAGLEAGYMVTDPVEAMLVSGGTLTGGALPAAGVTVAAGTIPATQIPLIIEDKTFVPANISQQDAKWNIDAAGAAHAVWGQPGDLWFPHVYEPNQGPTIASGVNPVGRWDYGPNFWPIFEANQAIPTGEFGNPSFVPESYQDTPVINGTAYPTLTVNPQAYRFRILNASNDRFINLGLYKADPNPTVAPQLDQNGNPIINAAGAQQYFLNTEVKMVPAVADVTGAPLTPTSGTLPAGATTGAYPFYDPTCLCQYAALPQLQPTIAFSGPTRAWPVDNRVGGAPDPTTVGPDFIAIGTDGGLLPNPVDIPSQPITYEQNRRSVTVTNVYGYGLLLGPQERSDVIVDFSAYAGQTLILYNDAPAPFPFNDQRVDYFTGDGDQTGSGGAYNTLPGYGPNTRTMMQIKVTGTVGVNGTPFNANNLLTALPAAYAASQPAPIVPETAYNAAFGTSDQDNYGRVATGSAAQPTLAFTRTAGAAQQIVLTGINIVSSTGAGSGSGTGYLAPPIVNINGGGGTGATAVAVLNAANQVGSVTLTNAGSGYTTPPTVTFTPTSTVSAISVGDGGAGYTAPVVTLSAPQIAGGTQATATATLVTGGSPILSAATLVTGGSGYVAAPTVTFVGGGGSGATATATVSTSALNPAGAVTAPGAGYTAPVVTLTPPSQTGGVNATATAVTAFSVSPTVAITAAGAGYDQSGSTSVTFSSPVSGTTAIGTATINPLDGSISSITVTNAGSGYTTAPTILITDQFNNVTATATATLAAGTGVVTGINITNVGSGYTSAPIATITDTTGTGATATTSLVNPLAGSVTGITITNIGKGYTSAPTVTLTDSVPHTGAALATATVALATPAGTITAIKITNAGTGYTTAPTVTITDPIGTGASASATIIAAGTGAQATIASSTSTAINVLTKAEQELFDAQGRYNSTGGSELPYTTANIQTTVPLQYVDTPTEVIGDGEAQIWKLVDNGFWSNSMHFDMNDVQLINRVGWDGTVKAPASNEVGWKDTLRLNPLEDVIVAIRAKKPTIPFGQPQSTRLQDPSIPAGAAGISLAAGLPAPARFTADPAVLSTPTQTLPNLPLLTTAVNTNVVNASLSVATSTPGVGNGNFDNEFTWGTAVLGHATDDFMRPVVFNPQVIIPAAATNLADPTGSGALTWTDPTPAGVATTLANPQNEIGFQILRADVANGAPSSAFVQVATVPANTTTWSNASLPATVNKSGAFEVVGYNAAGVSPASNFVIEGIPVAPTLFAPLPLLTPSFITPATTTSDVQVTVNWSDNSNNETNYVVTKTLGTVSGTTFTATGTPVSTTLPANTAPPSTQTTWVDPVALVEQSFYKYDVVAVNSYGTSTPVLSGTIQAPISVPLAPAPVTSALAAAVGKPANVNLGWTNLAFNQTGYSITRTGGAAFAPATLAANATAYVDTTAQEGFTYTYNVCATNTSLTGAVQSGCTSTVIASPITVPLQPTDLTATALTAPLDSNGLYPDVVTLKWTDKAFNETGYEILRGGVVIGTVNTTAATGTAMTYTDPTPAPSSLLDGHAYSYTVAAINSVNPSAAGVLATSNAAPVTMPGLALPAPTNVVATPNRAGAFIGLTWTNPASTTALPITGVLIQESINGGAWVNATAILPAGTATFRRNAAVAGNVYNFRIAEVNVAQKSDSAYTYIAATLSSPPAPAAPVFTSTAPVPAANGNVTLTWGAIAPIAGTTMAYRLNITVGGVTTTVNTARTTYTFRPTAAQVGAGATFSFTVQSVETATVVAGATLFGSSTSVASAPATVALTPAAAPAALASVTATVASATSATLSWTDNTTTETSYLVTILNNTTGVTTTATVTRTAAQTTGTGTAVTYNAAVVVGNSYTFSVVAQNTKYGVTMNSAAVSTTLVVPTLPAVPATPSVTSTATGVTVSWGTAVAGATAYTLQYSTNGGTTWTSVGTGATGVRMAALTGASTSAAVTGLTGNTSYTFHLLATNAVGSSAYSAASAATLTAPTVPTAARAANGTAGAPITGGLSWTAPAGGATSYIVSWTGPATGSVTIASPAVTTGQLTFATAGTYNMTVTAVNTTGSSPATAAVAVTVR